MYQYGSLCYDIYEPDGGHVDLCVVTVLVTLLYPPHSHTPLSAGPVPLTLSGFFQI